MLDESKIFILNAKSVITIAQANFPCMKLVTPITRSLPTREEVRLNQQSSNSTVVAKHASEEKFVILYICEITMDRGLDGNSEVLVVIDLNISVKVRKPSVKITFTAHLFICIDANSHGRVFTSNRNVSFKPNGSI